jgi:uncharacterized protein YqeY
MSLLDRIQADLVSAMKAKQEARLSALRMMKSALQRYTIDTGKPLDDAAAQQILKSMVKQRIDSADAFRKGNREELAVIEDGERKLIETYLPAAATDAELDEAVTAALAETGASSAKQMGLVIKAAQAKLAGKNVDGKTLSEKVKARLQ